MHSQHAHPPCPQHDCCCDELSPATGAFALSVFTQRGAEAHRTLLGPLDLARRLRGRRLVYLLRLQQSAYHNETGQRLI
jgi:hypothetical protein